MVPKIQNAKILNLFCQMNLHLANSSSPLYGIPRFPLNCGSNQEKSCNLLFKLFSHFSAVPAVLYFYNCTIFSILWYYYYYKFFLVLYFLNFSKSDRKLEKIIIIDGNLTENRRKRSEMIEI